MLLVRPERGKSFIQLAIGSDNYCLILSDRVLVICITSQFVTREDSNHHMDLIMLVNQSFQQR